jgi:phosphotransferase system enzyme I (PtsI)
LSEEEAEIFDAHLLVLDDKALLDETIHEMRSSGKNIEFCFHAVAGRYVAAFSKIDDDYIKERATDIRDVTRRLLRILSGKSDFNLGELTEEKIIVSDDLTPSETADLDKGMALGIVTDFGSRTSHSVIMARSIRVPAVVGLHDISAKIRAGDGVLVDGYEGIVVVNPSDATLYRYGKIKVEREHLREVFEEHAREPAVTVDGRSLTVLANVEGNEAPSDLVTCGAEGVGLFRTESIFLGCDTFPDEDEQFEAYRGMIEAFNPRTVIIRTLDLGGDKGGKFEYFPEEEDNPFMGFRAIRFCLEHKDVFKDQLRAILRASNCGNLKIMYPMISGVSELLAANQVLAEAKEELRQRGVDFDENVQVGSMIEVPSAAYTADLLAGHCDFFSIGTNDLIQYMLAVDRVNDRIAHLYEPNHPAVLRTIRSVIEAGHRKGLTVGICGEMAGDPPFVPLLFGMGADELSVTPTSVPETKYIIRKMKISAAEALAGEVLELSDPRDISDRLSAFHLELSK